MGALLLVAGFGIFFFLQREPSYGGKALSEWVDELGPDNVHSPEEEKAIRTIGPKAVPYLIEWIKQPTPPSEFQKRISRAEDGLHLSGEQHESDRRDKAMLAFEILGPAGKDAVPALAKMLNDPKSTSSDVSLSLGYIGTDSLPALTNALSSTNQAIRMNALLGLAQMGNQARAAVPLIATLMHSTNTTTSILAILDMGAFGEAAQPYISELNELLLTNHRPAAAFTLSHLGQDAELLRHLTNQSTDLRSSCLAGLENSGFCRGLFQTGAARIRAKFAHHPANRGKSLQELDEETIYVSTLYLSSTNAAERAQAADDLDFFSRHACYSVASLYHALSDTNEIVRHSAAEALKKIDLQVQDGGIIRGPRKEKKIALEFTGHQFAEGGDTILTTLAEHHAKASFFLTGDFLRNAEFKPLIQRMAREGHYIGSHSDKHLLYCEWGTKKTLVTRQAFEKDTNLRNALPQLQFLTSFWIPPFEWYNQEIADWSSDMDLVLVNYTPGTRSNADYTQESDPNFVSSQAIFDSILKKEREDPDGLNGFLLLMHLGAGPGRKDKFYPRLGELLDALSAKGYRFVRIDELLGEGPMN